MGSLLAALGLALLSTSPSWADPDRLAVRAIRYDQDYPAIDYSGPARHNRVWRMQEKTRAFAHRLSEGPTLANAA